MLLALVAPQMMPLSSRNQLQNRQKQPSIMQRTETTIPKASRDAREKLDTRQLVNSSVLSPAPHSQKQCNSLEPHHARRAASLHAQSPALVTSAPSQSASSLFGSSTAHQHHHQRYHHHHRHRHHNHQHHHHRHHHHQPKPQHYRSTAINNDDDDDDNNNNNDTSSIGSSTITTDNHIMMNMTKAVCRVSELVLRDVEGSNSVSYTTPPNVKKKASHL